MLALALPVLLATFAGAAPPPSPLLAAGVPRAPKWFSPQQASGLELCPEAHPVLAPASQCTNATRTRLAGELAGRTSDRGGVVLVFGGSVELRQDGADTELPFRQRSNFLYLTQCSLPDFAVAIRVDGRGREVESVLFYPDRDAFWALWNGVVATPEQIQEEFGLPCASSSEILSGLRRLTEDAALPVLTLESEADFAGHHDFHVETKELLPALHRARVVKVPEEISYLRVASRVSSAAHDLLIRDVRPGIGENNLAAFFRFYTENCGLVYQAYPPIAGAGAHAAILHYTANNAAITNGDLVLVDAGAEFKGYAADITRTFPANHSFGLAHKAVYDLVSGITSQVEKAIRPGVLWTDLHKMAYSAVCKGLLEQGYLRGSLDELVSEKVCGIFFPHGLGHSVGLDVHDPGSILELQEGMVVTVEPGVYFNAAFVKMGYDNPEQEPFMVRENIDLALSQNFGGVRVEDVVLVTHAGHEVLSPAVKDAGELAARRSSLKL
jgi:Xaa-Pro dipeptidase